MESHILAHRSGKSVCGQAAVDIRDNARQEAVVNVIEQIPEQLQHDNNSGKQVKHLVIRNTGDAFIQHFGDDDRRKRAHPAVQQHRKKDNENALAFRFGVRPNAPEQRFIAVLAVVRFAGKSGGESHAV